MANFPTRYYPDYPQTPGLGYSPYRTQSQYAPSAMGSGYPPPTGAMFRTEYPPMETITETSDAGPAAISGQNYQAINKRYKYYGYALVLLAFAILGVEIGNVAYTCNKFDVSNASKVPKPFGTPYILTWIAPGIWGSIPLFITGYLAVRVSGKQDKQIRIFALFCALSAAVFTPAILAISITEIVLYPNNNYMAALCYNFANVSTLSCPKFVLAVVVAVLGGIAFLLTVLVTVVFSFWWNPQGDFAEETETTQVVDEYYPYTRYPPTSLPPPAQPFPEQVPVYQQGPTGPSRVTFEPDMEFLRSYPVYRAASSRGFGFAPAYNRQSYGGRFQGMLPSLTTGFGNQEPNPAYMVPYA